MRALAIGFLAAFAAACAPQQEAAPVGYGSDLGTSANPTPRESSYTVQSRVSGDLGLTDVTAAIGDLQAFSQHGGATLLAQASGTSSGQALNALPSALQSKLGGWIDTELDKQKLGSQTARAAVGQIAAMADSIVSSFVLESQLSITPSGAVHSLIDLDFDTTAADIAVPIGGLTGDVLDQEPSATVGDGGALTVGDQQFSLAFGQHAWQGLNLAAKEDFGGDLTIIERLNCSAIAQAVAAKCVGSSCVGHQSDLLAVCTTGLASLVTQLSGTLGPVELDSLRFMSGTAQLVDDDGDGIADRIVNGTWDAQTDFGMGVHATQVAFDSDN